MLFRHTHTHTHTPTHTGHLPTAQLLLQPMEVHSYVFRKSLVDTHHFSPGDLVLCVGTFVKAQVVPDRHLCTYLRRGVKPGLMSLFAEEENQSALKRFTAL